MCAEQIWQVTMDFKWKNLKPEEPNQVSVIYMSEGIKIP
jgi:hypothetical protein